MGKVTRALNQGASWKHMMRVNSYLKPRRNSPMGKEPTLVTEQAAEWTPEPGWTF